METTPPSHELQFFLTLLLKHILATHVSYDKAFKTITTRYHVPKWLLKTFYKVGWYFITYYYGIRWLSAKYGYGTNPAGLAAYFASLGFSVKQLQKKLREEAPRLSISKKLSILYGFPEYLVKDLLSLMDKRELEKMLRKLNEKKRWLRINTLKTTPEEAISLLEENGVVVSRSHIVDYMVYVEHPKWGSLRGIEAVRKGVVVSQDLASALAIDILPLEKYRRLLDACSAPGNKLSQAFMLANNRISALAIDKSLRRLLTEKELLNRLGVNKHLVVLINADSSIIHINGSRFDLAIVDAPCSGSGAVSSDPAIKLSIMRKDKLRYYHEVQYSILKNLLLNKVRLIEYITCSIHPLEGEIIVDRLIDEGLAEPLRIDDKRLSNPYQGFKSSDRVARIMPHIHNSQGFFIALLKNTRG